MIQRGHRARFLFKPAQPVFIARKRRRKNLQRNVSAKARVSSAIHLAHSAHAKQRNNFIRTNFRSGVQCHKRV
jgi:hypothetical protein